MSGLQSLHNTAVHMAIMASWFGLLCRVCVAACKRLSTIGACCCISKLTSSHLILSSCSLEWRRRTELQPSLHRVAISDWTILPTLLMMCFLTTGSCKKWETIPYKNHNLATTLLPPCYQVVTSRPQLACYNLVTTM